MEKSRLLVWARDTSRFHRGDVVDVLPSGKSAGKSVENHSDWVILEVDGSPDDHAHLLTSHFHEDGTMALHRIMKINLDSPNKEIITKPLPSHPKVIR